MSEKSTVIKTAFPLVAIVLAFFSISFGIWNAGVPFGDECGYIEAARELNASKKYSSNLYLLSYQIIFKVTQASPVSAHIILRTISSLSSVFLLYLLFKRVKTRLNDLAILLICIFWMNCNVNIPLVQYGNINLFTLNIALVGTVLLLNNLSLNTFFICISAMFLCAKIRPEYWIAVFLVPSYMLYAKRDFIFNSTRENIISYLSQAKTGLIVLFLSIIFIFNGSEQKRNFDKYLLLGLSQSYTYLYAKTNPNLNMNTMLEYSSLIDEVFDKPTGFVDAAIKNPYEITRYFLINGFVNIILLLPSLLYHRHIISERLLSVQTVILIITAVPFIETVVFLKDRVSREGGLQSVLRTRISKIFSCLAVFISNRTDISILIILALVASVSVPLLIPDPRYWISCIPLLLLWLTWGFSKTFERLTSKKILFTMVVIICVWLSRPMFMIKNDNRNLIEMIEQHGKRTGIVKPVVAGQTSVGTYVFCKFTPVNINQMDLDFFTHRKFDYFIVDKTIIGSQFWETNHEVLEKFFQRPETFGYSLIYASKQSGELLCAFAKNTAL